MSDSFRNQQSFLLQQLQQAHQQQQQQQQQQRAATATTTGHQQQQERLAAVDSELAAIQQRCSSLQQQQKHEADRRRDAALKLLSSRRTASSSVPANAPFQSTMASLLNGGRAAAAASVVAAATRGKGTTTTTTSVLAGEATAPPTATATTAAASLSQQFSERDLLRLLQTSGASAAAASHDPSQTNATFDATLALLRNNKKPSLSASQRQFEELKALRELRGLGTAEMVQQMSAFANLAAGTSNTHKSVSATDTSNSLLVGATPAGSSLSHPLVTDFSRNQLAGSVHNRNFNNSPAHDASGLLSRLSTSNSSSCSSGGVDTSTADALEMLRLRVLLGNHHHWNPSSLTASASGPKTPSPGVTGSTTHPTGVVNLSVDKLNAVTFGGGMQDITKKAATAAAPVALQDNVLYPAPTPGPAVYAQVVSRQQQDLDDAAASIPVASPKDTTTMGGGMGNTTSLANSSFLASLLKDPAALALLQAQPELLAGLEQLPTPAAAKAPTPPPGSTIWNNLKRDHDGIMNKTNASASSANGKAPAAAVNDLDVKMPPLKKRAIEIEPPAAGLLLKSAPNKAVQENANGEEDDEELALPDLPAVRPLPPLEEGDTPHYTQRLCVPLATEEDSNWLSERQCFIRSELLEVVRASHQDVLVRSSSKSVAYQQVGIRCRFCAHLHPSARAIRSSAYPSSIRQMYQSFTMMVRDHWAGCNAMPPKLKKRFMDYQEHKIPSSSLSREYWAYAAEKIGMINTDYGITINEETMAKATEMHSFGTTPEHLHAMKDEARRVQVLVSPQDQSVISPYLFLLMSQMEECYLLPSERVGKRKDAPVGLTGFGCRHCISQGRLGFCRVFPLNKRSLPTKVNDLYNHLQRCPLTPAATRSLLRQYKRQNDASASNSSKHKAADRDREFIDQIWTKLGRKGAQINSS